MPEGKAPEGDNTQALQPDSGAIIPRIKLGEQGVLGLKISNKQIYEESQRAFKFPAMVRTVEEIRHVPTVNAAMNVYRMMMARIPWDVEAPANATEIEKKRTEAVRSMMHDMDHSWASFIQSVFPYLEYGFGVTEKVFRRRLKKNGSKWDDGLVGLKKLAHRAQGSIVGWEFSDDGADLVAVHQTLAYSEHPELFRDKVDPNTGNIKIPREKFLLFSASSTNGNPEGTSIYRGIYLAIKQLTMLQDNELLGIAKDVQGMLKIGLPPRYLDVNASQEDKAVATAYQRMIDNYNEGKQRGFLVPHLIDPETKQPMFVHEIMDAKGVAKYDTEDVIKRLQMDILSALNCDVIKLGADGSGSFSLASEKTSILALAIDYRMREIADVLNSDLMPSLFSMNGWEQTNLPKFVYRDVEEIDIESYSKAIQRIFTSGAVEITRDVLNKIRNAMGWPELPADAPVDEEALAPNMTGKASASGAGMAPGTTGDGTSKGGSSGQNRSDNNANNTG